MYFFYFLDIDSIIHICLKRTQKFVQSFLFVLHYVDNSQKVNYSFLQETVPDYIQLFCAP